MYIGGKNIPFTDNEYKKGIILNILGTLNSSKKIPIIEKFIFLLNGHEIQRLMLNQTQSINTYVDSVKYYLVKHLNLSTKEEKITLIDYDELREKNVGRKFILNDLSSVSISNNSIELVSTAFQNYPMDEIKIRKEKMLVPYSPDEILRTIEIGDIFPIQTTDKEFIVVLISNIRTNEDKITCVKKSFYFDVVNRYARSKEYLKARFF